MIITYQDVAMILENTDSPPISYNITYADASSGRFCGSVTISASLCLNGVCCHTFGEISPPCSSDGDISIFIFATSVLGDGPPSQPLIFSLKTSGEELGKSLLCACVADKSSISI